MMAISVRASVKGRAREAATESPVYRDQPIPRQGAAWSYPRRVASVSCRTIRRMASLNELPGSRIALNAALVQRTKTNYRVLLRLAISSPKTEKRQKMFSNMEVMQKYGRSQVEALTTASSTFTKGLQQIAEETAGFSKKHFETSSAALQEKLVARRPSRRRSKSRPISPRRPLRASSLSRPRLENSTPASSRKR